LKNLVPSGDGGRWSCSDEHFMRAALDLARQSKAAGEVPVGAVLVRYEAILGRGRNRPIETSDPTSHAEVEALREAGVAAGNYRLAGSTLYVTIEPCLMCVGAIVLARVERLVFAARDIRFGAVRSKFALADSELLNHQVRVEEGLLAAEAASLMGDFFAGRRKPLA